MIAQDSLLWSEQTPNSGYWAAKLGKDELQAFQASPRGGSLQVLVAGDRVLLAGQAVTVMRGELLPPLETP